MSSHWESASPALLGNKSKPRSYHERALQRVNSKVVIAMYDQGGSKIDFALSQLVSHQRIDIAPIRGQAETLSVFRATYSSLDLNEQTPHTALVLCFEQVPAHNLGYFTYNSRTMSNYMDQLNALEMIRESTCDRKSGSSSPLKVFAQLHETQEEESLCEWGYRAWMAMTDPLGIDIREVAEAAERKQAWKSLEAELKLGLKDQWDMNVSS